MVDKYKFYSGIIFVTFWVMVAANFVGYELTGSYALKKASAFPADFVLLVFGLLTLRNRVDIAVVVSFTLLSFFTSIIINHESMIVYLNGYRNYLGMLFAMPIIRYMTSREDWRAKFIPSFDRQLYIFLILQFVTLVYQLFRYGANDHGGGLFSMGGSGMASMLLYAVSFYLVSKNWDTAKSYGANLRDNLKYVWPLLGSMLNETKASFIYMALYFILLYRFNIMSTLKLLMMTPVIAVAAFGLFMAYLELTDQDFDRLTSTEFYEAYLTGGADSQMLIDVALMVQDHDLETDNLWVVDLPRFTKLLLLDELMDHAAGGDALGAGIGQFKGGTTMELTGFASSQQWALQGSRPMLFNLVVEIGWVGAAWFLLSFLAELALHRNPRFMSLRNKILLICFMAVIMVYNDTFFNPVMPLLFYYIALSMSLPPDSEGRTAGVFDQRYLNSSHQ